MSYKNGISFRTFNQISFFKIEYATDIACMWQLLNYELHIFVEKINL